MIGGSNRMLSLEETAEYLGVSKSTLYTQWREWGLQGYKVGRLLKFRSRDIEAWLERSKAE